MKVKEFIKLLLNEDQDAEVIIAGDEEGNSFSPLDDISKEIYVPENDWSGEIFPIELSDDMEEEDLYQGDDGVKAIVLWPTN